MICVLLNGWQTKIQNGIPVIFAGKQVRFDFVKKGHKTVKMDGKKKNFFVFLKIFGIFPVVFSQRSNGGNECSKIFRTLFLRCKSCKSNNRTGKRQALQRYIFLLFFDFFCSKGHWDACIIEKKDYYKGNYPDKIRFKRKNAGTVTY